MKREKRLTKKERKSAAAQPKGDHQHIHCVACGRHLHGHEFTASPVTARYLSCQHGHKFPVCATCVTQGQQLLREHDRTGQPIQTAQAWH